MKKIETRKCPLCGGTMVKSKTKRGGYARFFWAPPWKSRTTGMLKPIIEATPWLCLDCGAVMAFVDDETRETLREEYEKERATGIV
ncbi:hypothetical protein [Thermococcus sp. 21S7]|uniref:hypothetical protein n=1 Tax=Thermococcus sp. 21S7 TaxID=1638221 RepID=UPI0014393EDB|nr:hypothetical protein [Thermococcus sp. 21S7]NJE61274.1 hypothetical protein [Thermococcus sp. 21S7]